MRALFVALAFLLPLLTGCQTPPPNDYWHGGASSSAGGQAHEGDYVRLMADGTRANLAGRPTVAEARFREALRIQRRKFGDDSPELALPMMSLALQLSAEGRFREADVQFSGAERVLHGSKDRALLARLLHYRGENMLNQKHPAEAEVLLSQAQVLYTAQIPQEDLTRAPVPRLPLNQFDVNSGGRITNATNFQAMENNPLVRPLLLGLIEVLRYRSIASRDLGHLKEADALTAYATRLAAANDLNRPSVLARLLRTAGVTQARQEHSAVALSDLAHSDSAFETALPGTRPAAEAALTRAGELVKAGHPHEAKRICRRAVHILIEISVGTSPELMAPCLAAYATDGTPDQADLADMFEAAQVAQGTITSHQIAQASAALEVSARDPRVGAVLRRRDAYRRQLEQIYRDMDTLAPGGTSGPVGDQIAALQRQADQVQTALTDAEAEVRRLAPNYSQLVQDVVPASAVFQALHSDEAFVALFLSSHDGWTFALRHGEIAISRIQGGSDVIGPLVRAIRGSIEKTEATSLPVFDIAGARRLYGLTLAGVANQIQGAKALVFAPTGPLLSLPFEVMLTGPADPTKLATAPWLVRQATITHVPAPTNFVSLRRVAGTSRAARPWFGFGDFIPVTVAQADASFPVRTCGDSGRLLASLPPLPGAVKELEGARAVLGASASDELLGQAFTVAQVMKEPLQDYRILHFAAHALLPTDLRCQSEAAIVTSDPVGATNAGEALLTASRVLGLNLDANLVILSACNSGGPSGGGASGAGESLSGLARSFFFAKARALLVTHWEVSDQVAALLVVLTVNNMKEHPSEGVTGALRQAQLSLLDRAADGRLPAEIAHPFFWAPFAVIGEGGEGAGTTTVSSRTQTGL
jgi:CHAT domain-containing protein